MTSPNSRTHQSDLHHVDDLLALFDEPFVVATYRTVLLREPDPVDPKTQGFINRPLFANDPARAALNLATGSV